MSRPVFGRPIAAAVSAASLAIITRCRDPQDMTAARLAGQSTPCYRCLALDPEQRCHFVRRLEETRP